MFHRNFIILFMYSINLMPQFYWRGWVELHGARQRGQQNELAGMEKWPWRNAEVEMLHDNANNASASRSQGRERGKVVSSLGFKRWQSCVGIYALDKNLPSFESSKPTYQVVMKSQTGVTAQNFPSKCQHSVFSCSLLKPLLKRQPTVFSQFSKLKVSQACPFVYFLSSCFNNIY